MAPFVSVIVTVKNEEANITTLITSLLNQTLRPDEIVIVDGGSTDRTVETIERFVDQGEPIRLFLAPGSNISQGRNIAISHAYGEIIASTDAGVKLSPDWLKFLVGAFEKREDADGGMDVAADVVSGFFVSDPHSVFEMAMGATVLPNESEIERETFLPSSRSVAFKKEAWRRVGGYPEWLDYCEDVWFDLELRKAGYRFVFVPAAVTHFRPRQNIRQFFKQYYLYARGDGKAALWPKRHFVRYAAYVIAPLALLLGFWYKLLWLLLIGASAVYLQRPYWRLWPVIKPLRRSEQFEAILWVPLIRLVGDVAKMVGYPVGVWWRLRNGKPNA